MAETMDHARSKNLMRDEAGARELVEAARLLCPHYHYSKTERTYQDHTTTDVTCDLCGKKLWTLPFNTRLMW